MKIRYEAAVLKKDLKRIGYSDKKKITKKIELLSTYPLAGKKLQGELRGLRALRAWPYRIVYEIKNKEIKIYSIIHRQSVYKRK